MEDLRAKGGIFRHGGPHMPYGSRNFSAYDDGSLGRYRRQRPLVGLGNTVVTSLGAIVALGAVLWLAYKIAPKG